MGFFDNLDDPKTQLLLQLGLGLLGGAPGQRKNFGADLAHAGQQGLLGYSQAKGMQAKLAEEKQQQEYRGLQMAQMKREQDRAAQEDALAPKYFGPQSYPQGMTGDDQGNPMPALPPKQDFQGYSNALMGINPMKGIALQQSMMKDSPFGKVDPKDYTPESLQAFAATRDYTQLRPRSKVEVTNGLAYDPYATKPGSFVSGPLADVVPDGRGGFTYNNAKINPLERARVGLEAQRVGMDQQRLGMDRQRLALETPGPNGITPKDLSQANAGVAKEGALAAQTAQRALPDVEAQAQDTIGLVDKMLKHPGFSTTVGAKGPTGVFAAAGRPIPGTDAADFIALRDQLLGKQFMEAYQTLKGGGQITEVEGKKATDAMSRMNTAQSEAAFQEAAKDFKNVLQAGLMRARRKAGSPTGFRVLGKE